MLNNQGDRINILLVDDNPDNLRLLSNLLTNHGYQTRRVISGKMALQAVKANSFDLIFLDINMPEMDGYEVCRQLKADSRTVSIPIIFISALNEVLDKVKAFSVGGADYISKPFQFEEVIARVENQVQIISLQQELLKFSTELEKKVNERTKKLQIANEDLRKYQKELLEKSLKDPITKLDSQLSFMGHLRKAVRQSAIQPSYCFSLIVFDCYSPQLIAEAFDLQTEDLITQELAKRLSSCISDKILAHLREREFVTIVENIQDKQQVLKIADRVRGNLVKTIAIGDRQFAIEAHYGVSFRIEDTDTAEDLLKSARTMARQRKNQHYCQSEV